MPTTPRTLDFIFDFGSPNAYLCHKVLPDFAARTGLTVNYVPCLLGGIFKATGNKPPFMAFAPVKMQYELLELKRFVRRHKIPYRMNPHFPVNTLALMRGAMVARDEGFLLPYVDGILRYMWETPRKLDDPAVFAQTLTELGFDAEHILRRSADEDIKQALADSTAAAVERGVFGIPTFFLGDEMWFGKERLRDIEEFLAEAQPAGESTHG